MAACERVIVESKPLNWDQLSFNIFSVCHSVQTLTQSLCVFFRKVCAGSQIDTHLEIQDRTHVRTQTLMHSWRRSDFRACVRSECVYYVRALLPAKVLLVMGRVKIWKCLTFLSFSCFRKAKREREGRDMFRPRPNNKRLHTESVTPLHSQCITHFRPMLHPAACITHSAVSSQKRRFSLEGQQLGNIWHSPVVVCVCLCVSRSSLGGEARAACLSWEGGGGYRGNRHAKAGPALPRSAAGRQHRDLQSQRT